jgi:hypothetical protein
MRRPPLTPIFLALLWGVSACGDSTSSTSSPAATPTPQVSAPSVPDTAGTVIDPGDGGNYTVSIDPSRFTPVVDHPFLPKIPGTRWVYSATPSDGEAEIITIEVLDERRTVMGVETIVVHDMVRTVSGELIEDTYDWFAQDDRGNVWYFGEDTTAYADGVESHAGAWEAGVGGAVPGIVMPADPDPSAPGYRQEYLAGEAEDMAQVITRATGSVVTRDWTPLEPGVIEEKAYAEGVGFVYEWKAADDGSTEAVTLISFEAGG